MTAQIPVVDLAVFIVIATAIFYNPVNTNQMLNFTKNVIVIGGLLIISAYGAGKISIDKCNKKSK